MTMSAVIRHASYEQFIEYDRNHLRLIYKKIFGQEENSVQLIREAFIERFFPEHVGYCLGCGVKTHYKHDERRYILYCDRQCMYKSEAFRDSMKDGYARNHGMTQGQFLQQKHIAKQRCRVLRSAEVQAKREHTLSQKYGVSNPMFSEKFKANLRATNRERYGADFALQNPKQFAKWLESAFKTKWYITSDGKRLPLQGYERQIADTLEQHGWTVRSPKKAVRYVFSGKERVYHPDLVLKKGTRRILAEVKSDYTLLEPKSFKRNMAKFRAVSDQDFVLFVMLPRAKDFVSIQNPARFSKRELRDICRGHCLPDGVRRIKCLSNL